MIENELQGFENKPQRVQKSSQLRVKLHIDSPYPESFLVRLGFDSRVCMSRGARKGKVRVSDNYPLSASRAVGMRRGKL